jgi:hypothetical protein
MNLRILYYYPTSLSEFFSYILINTIVNFCCSDRHCNSYTLVDFFYNLLIQIWGDDDLLCLHFLKILVSVLVVILVVVMFDQLSEYITKSNGFLYPRSVNQAVTNLHCCGCIVAGRSKSLSCLNELLDDADSLSHHRELHFFVFSIRLLKLPHGLFHCSKGFFVVPILVNLYLGTSIIEIG